MNALNIEIFSDLICPWCYIGRRRLEAGLKILGANELPNIIWHPFELNPQNRFDTVVTDCPFQEGLGESFGGSVLAGYDVNLVTVDRSFHGIIAGDPRNVVPEPCRQFFTRTDHHD